MNDQTGNFISVPVSSMSNHILPMIRLTAWQTAPMVTFRSSRAGLALAAALLLGFCISAQMGMPGQFGGNRPTYTAVKTDIPYIRCGVCEALAKNAYRQVKTARDALPSGKKVRSGGLIRQSKHHVRLVARLLVG